MTCSITVGDLRMLKFAATASMNSGGKVLAKNVSENKLLFDLRSS